MSRFESWREEHTANDPTAYDGIRALQQRQREKQQRPTPQPQQTPIDLDALVVAVLDGAVGDQPMSELATMDGACAAVTNVVVEKAGRALTVSEQMKVDIATATEFNRRKIEKREGLRDTQERLHNPMFGMRGAS